MKVAYLTGIRQLEIRQAPQPQIVRPDDVLLRVDVVGVCGSDMHYYRQGRIGSQVIRFPWTVGHECAGTVVQAGPEVRLLKAGDRVAVDPLISCGACDQCRAGRRHTCRNQAFLGCPGQAGGAIAEYLVMPAECCYRVADSLNLVQAALVEPFSVGLYSQRLFGGPAGESLAILGCGPIGLSVLGALKAAGDCTVYATDIRDNRAALARRLGADWTGNPRGQDAVAAILALEPLGMDCVFECAGEQETIDQAVDLLKPGGTLMLVGIPEQDRVSLNMDLLRRKELRIQNVRRQNECVRDALTLAAQGKVDLEAMVTHQFTIDQAKEAFDLVADYRDNVVKAMIRISQA